MLKATIVITLATLSTLNASMLMSQAQQTIPQMGSEVLQDIHNKPTQQVFFSNPKLKTIPLRSPNEQHLWTRNLSKDWVIQTQQKQRSSTVLQPDMDKDDSDLRVLFHIDKPNP